MLTGKHFRRLFLPLLFLILGGTIVVALWTASVLRKTYIVRAKESLYEESVLIRELTLTTWQSGLQQLPERVRRWGSRIDRQITVMNALGEVLGDNAPGRFALVNQAQYPEIEQAEVGSYGFAIRRSEALGVDMMYVAVALDEDDQRLGYVRLATPMISIEHSITTLYRRLAAGATLAFGVAVLICYLIAYRLTHPMLSLVRSVNDVSNSEAHGVKIASTDDGGTLADLYTKLGSSLKRLVDQLFADRKELQALLSSMVEGVITVDRKDVVTVVNPAAGRFFQFDPQKAVGRQLGEIIHNPVVLALIEEVKTKRTPARIRLGPVPAAMELDVVVCSVEAAHTGGGLVILAHDVAESQRYRELRSEFVANVSHELRTPLTFIGGFVETLRQGAINDPDKRDHFLQRIEHNVELLTSLVNDLLALSEIQERKADEGKSPTDLVPILNSLCATFRTIAEKKDQQLNITITAQRLNVMGRPLELERAFSNLIDNAIKYTDRGGQITVSARRENGRALVAISDTGSGIPHADIQRIFERFYRVDKSRSRSIGGTGLGLSIVKHVVDAHGGEIRVSSAPQHGSQFNVWLPCCEDDTSGAVP